MPSACWQVRLLGGLELSRQGERLTRLPSRAHVALLARLALAPERAHAREELVELLWPGVALDAGRNRLRQVLSTLKSVLEPVGSAQPVVLADRMSLRVAPHSLQCDALRFEQFARAGRHDEAVALYRGELLPGYYDGWIHDERMRLAGLHERLHPAPSVASMVAPLRVGGAAPAAGAPRRSAWPIAEMARANLPHYLTPLFGIDDAVARLRALVLQRRLVTVLGPGGGGKTRLAVQAARSFAAADESSPGAPTPFDRVVFVALDSCASAAQMFDALLAALQFTSAAGPAAESALAALADRRVLLLLDNFEQLDDAATAGVARLLGRLPQLHVLVTSRRHLGIEGEHEFAISTLALPAAPVDLAEAAAHPALALLIDRARAVRADFHPSARNLPTLVALLHELEGLPLAIELAASRLRSLAPAELLRRLRAGGTPRLTLLARAAGRAGAEPRHASMRHVVSWSWGQLEAPARRLLAALTVFRGPFSAAAASELVAPQDHAHADALFDELLAHSLLRQTETVDDAPRYWPYESVREHASTQLDEADARAARARLRAWALLWARQLPPTPSLPALRAEMPNLVAAFASAAQDGAGADAVDLLAALGRALEDASLPSEGLTHALAAVQCCADDLRRAQGLTLLAQPLFIAGEVDAAIDAAVRGLAGCAGTPWHARALHALARVRWRSTRRPEQVEPLLAEAFAIEAGAPDPDLRAGLLALQAFIANTAQRGFARAAELHRQALALWIRGGNQHAVASGRYNLAVCAQNADRHAETLELLAPVLASARDQHDHRRISQSLNVQGNAYSGLRQWQRAIDSYRECLQVAWAVMAPFDLAYGFWNLPRALAHVRQPERAVRLMAFSATFWRERFGELSAHDERYMLRVRRLVLRLQPQAAWGAWWQEGALLTLAQAFELATAD